MPSNLPKNWQHVWRAVTLSDSGTMWHMLSRSCSTRTKRSKRLSALVSGWYRRVHDRVVVGVENGGMVHVMVSIKQRAGSQSSDRQHPQSRSDYTQHLL